MHRRSLFNSTLVFILLMGFFLPAFIVYAHLERVSREERAQFLAAQVGRRIDEMIKSRLEAMSVLDTLLLDSSNDGYDAFVRWARRIQSAVPGFLSVNRVDPSGKLIWVVSQTDKTNVTGKNLLEIPDLAPYMIQARDSRQPQLTHIVKLFSGDDGMIVYFPVYGPKGFDGWLDAVFNVERLFGALATPDDFNGRHFALRFSDHPDHVYEQGTQILSDENVHGSAKLTVLNQKLEVALDYDAAAIQGRGETTLRWLIVFGVIASSAVLAAIAYKLMRSRDSLRERLEKVQFQGILLNLLVHDLSNPLLVVRLGADAAMKVAGPDVKVPLAKVNYAIDQLNNVISRVKDLRQVDLGKARLDVTSVDVNVLIADSFRLFETQGKEKGLTLDFRRCPEDLRLLVDRVIFQNNVLNNVVSNAVKFTASGGRITVTAASEGPMVAIEVKDSGMGMAPEILENLFLEHAGTSKPGTLGEQGTGIGMLQVRSYMRLFGGIVTVESRQKATHPADHGTRFRLLIPRAPD